MLPLHLAGDRLCFFSSQIPPSLITLPIHSAWLLANQCFVKLIQVTSLYSVQEHYLTAKLLSCNYQAYGLKAIFLL